jgi:cell fate regulator YaaT (PSP1 superfamily)
MLLTPEFGPLQRVAFIFTDAEFDEYDEMYNGEPLCRKCGACVRECPGGCIPAINSGKTITVDIEGKISEWGDIDMWRCYAFYTHAGRYYNPFVPKEVWDKNEDGALDLMEGFTDIANEQEIMKVFVKKIEEHKLSMKAIDVEYTFDGSKILFYFTAENRVDFREIVKDLAGIYRTRIELRQIGVRDEAKMLGGLGICGRPFCCSSFLGEFQPVSIKMAKEQSLSLNPTKISGTCGRLMCCLKYEQDCYEELLKITPKIDAYVETAEGKGVVVETNILTGVIKVRLDKKQDAPPITVKRDEVKVLKDAKIRVNRDEIAALKELED